MAKEERTLDIQLAYAERFYYFIGGEFCRLKEEVGLELASDYMLATSLLHVRLLGTFCNEGKKDEAISKLLKEFREGEPMWGQE